MVEIVNISDCPAQSVNSKYVLGIACTGHGASLAIAGRDGILRASVFDRWCGAKHALVFAEAERKAILNAETSVDEKIRTVILDSFGHFPSNYAFEEIFDPWLGWLLKGTGVHPTDIGSVVTSDSYFATCRSRLAHQLGRWLPSLTTVAMMEHHAIHQRQAFWQSGFQNCAILTLDTCGEKLGRLGDRRLAGTIARKRIGKPFDTIKDMFYPESSAGLIYALVNHHVGFRQGDEGKTMGLAPYGSPRLYKTLREHLFLHEDGNFSFLSKTDFADRLNQYVPPRMPGDESTILDEHRDVAFAGQAIIEEIIRNCFRCVPLLTGEPDLVYAGGLALNSVANGIAIEEAKPRRVYIAPNPSDTGQALGCALAGAYEMCGWEPPRVEVSDFLGPAYTPDEICAGALTNTVNVEQPRVPEPIIARCIANGAIVATFAERAEFGPRALGHRSILCDPRHLNMKDYVNARVKHRESFRPFAPSVLEEHVSDWFCLEDRSPYMLRVVSLREGKRDLVPAIIHVDGTARVQTVSPVDNPSYWSLIHEFHLITGVPLVLNTSFNVQGKPIVETPDDAVACFRSTDIDILFMKPFVIPKKPLRSYLENQLNIAI